MAQPVQLSDGSVAFVDDNQTPEQVSQFKQGVENEIAQDYMKKAADPTQGGLYVPTKPDGTPGDTIYTPTNSYPNTTYGHGAAATDRVFGDGTAATAARISSQAGSFLASRWLDPGLAAVGALKAQLGPDARGPLPALLGQPPPGTSLNPLQKGVGWVLGPGDPAENAQPGVFSGLRRYATTPEAQDTEPVPLFSQVAREDLGATGTDMPADASFQRRVAEAVGAAGLSRAGQAGIEALTSYLRGAAPATGAGAATAAGTAGAAASPAAAAGAAAAQGAAPAVQSALAPVVNAVRAVATNPAVRNVGSDALWSTLGTGASDVAGRLGAGPVASYLASLVFGGAVPGRRLVAAGLGPFTAKRPDIAGEGGAADINEQYQAQRGPNDPEYPSFKTLANPPWQRVATWLGNVPFFGNPLSAAHEATVRFVQNLVRRGAGDIAAQGGGTLPPQGSITPESIGQLGTLGAREAIPRVRQYMSDLYAPINEAGQDQSFNVAPVAAGVAARLRQNPTTPALTSAIYGHLGQLTEAAPGHGTQAPTSPAPPGTMNVPASGPPTAPGAIDVPMSVGREWLSNTSRMLGPTGPLRSNDMPVLNMKNDAIDAMADRLNQITPGLGDTLRGVRSNYADMRKTVLDPLYELGGKPTDTGEFTPVPEQSAYNFINRNRMSPTMLEPMSRWFSPQYWGNMMGQYLSRAGYQPSGDFRADKVEEALGKIGPQVQTQMTGGNAGVAQGQPGGLPEAYRRLQAAANIGTATSTPISRHGMAASASTGAGTAAAIGAASHYLTPLFGWAGAIPASVYGASRFLESRPMKQAMTGQPLAPEITNAIYGALPRVGAIQANTERQLYPGGVGPTNWLNALRLGQ